MEYVLIFFYAIVFLLIIRYHRFFNIDGLSRKLISIIFILKIIAGIAYGLIYKYFYNIADADTYNYFRDSRIIYNSFFDNPLYYLQLTFGPNGGSIPEHLRSYIEAMGHWGYTGDYMVVRFNALIQLVSGGSYFVHIIFIAFVSLLGLIALFKLFNSSLPTPNSSQEGNKSKNTLLTLSIFFIPSVIFWGSGLHKEGLLLFSIGFFLLNFHLLVTKALGLKNLIACLFFAILIILIRGHLFILLLPSLIAYFWTIRKPSYFLIKFMITHLICWAIAFNVHYIFPGLNPIELIIEQQERFSLLAILFGSGQSGIPSIEMEANLLSLLANIPRALWNSFLFPYLWNPAKSGLQTIGFIETLMLIVIMIICVVFNRLKKINNRPILYLSLFYAITLLIIIGLIVPNLGAIARYRVIALPFLMSFFLLIFDYKSKIAGTTHP